MFGGKIRNLSVTGELGDFAFPDVKCDSFHGDVCFDAVAKVLLAPRGCKLRGNVFNLGDDCNVETAVDTVANIAQTMGNDELTFITAKRRDEMAELLEKAGDAIKAEGFVEDTRTSKFMMSFCSSKEVRVYSKADEHKTIVLAVDVSSHQWHVMLSGLTAFLPWCFEGDNKLKKNEIDLIMTLVNPEKSRDDFIAAIEQITSQFDLQTKAKELYLRGFEDRAIKHQLKGLEEQSALLARDIDSTMRSLQNYYERKAGVDSMLFAIKNADQKNSTALMEYFIANKKLLVDSVSEEDMLTYFVCGYIDNFNPDTFEVCLDNHHSVVYDGYECVSPDNISMEDYLTLLKAVFLETDPEKMLKIKMFSKWTLGQGCGVRPVGDAQPPAQLVDYLPNPHLCYYTCMGSFQPEISAANADYDYIRAVDITSIENGNVNWNDVTVMKKFTRDILTSKAKFIQLPDGTDCTNTEAIAWLKAMREMEEDHAQNEQA